MHKTDIMLIAYNHDINKLKYVMFIFCSYRTHKNFMAAYLGSGAEAEKLQKPIANVMV